MEHVYKQLYMYHLNKNMQWLRMCKQFNMCMIEHACMAYSQNAYIEKKILHGTARELLSII